MAAPKVLTNGEMDAIRAQEFVRVEVQKSLAENKESSNSLDVWKVLNSSFGLWLLSAVFITGAGAWYQRQEANRERETQVAAENRAHEKTRQARIDRLSMEFSYRLSNALIGLEEADRISQADRRRDREKMRLNALGPLINSSNDQFRPLFPEFLSYTGMTLIAELRTLTTAGETGLLKDKLANLSGLLSDPSSVDLTDPKVFYVLAGELLEKSKHYRWVNGFRYTDCDKQNPFC